MNLHERGPQCCGPRTMLQRVLLDDLRHATGANGAATLADSEAQTLFHGDRVNELALDLHVVARHDHLGALGEMGNARHVRDSEI